MGDFWPGNLLVVLDDKGGLERIYVVDWEMTRTGLPGIEVGQFGAEMHLLKRFHPEICGETATLLLVNFLREYKRTGDPSEEDMQWASIQFGTHLVILAGRVEWGAKELTREVVMEGVEVLTGRAKVM